MSRSFSGMVVRIHAQEIRTLHYVTVAHGVGAGLVIDGNIYK
jgi:predicted NBD/HSP70 family sugar kinase